MKKLFASLILGCTLFLGSLATASAEGIYVNRCQCQNPCLMPVVISPACPCETACPACPCDSCCDPCCQPACPCETACPACPCDSCCDPCCQPACPCNPCCDSCCPTCR